MKATVYIETSVVGYFTSWPRQDPLIAGHQYATKLWWATAEEQFDLFVSQLVVRECSVGDPIAVRERLDSIAGFSVLPITPAAEALAEALMQGGAVPQTEPNDALHIALAAIQGVKYLVSWNFRHIVNASMRPAIANICLDAGYRAPILCTPEELVEKTP